jgi:hypothetical protein
MSTQDKLQNQLCPEGAEQVCPPPILALRAIVRRRFTLPIRNSLANASSTHCCCVRRIVPEVFDDCFMAALIG